MRSPVKEVLLHRSTVQYSTVQYSTVQYSTVHEVTCQIQNPEQEHTVRTTSPPAPAPVNICIYMPVHLSLCMRQYLHGGPIGPHNHANKITKIINKDKDKDLSKKYSCTAVQYSTVQYSTVQYSTVQYSTVQYSTVQYSTVQYSTVQYSTVQYSTVQYSTVQYMRSPVKEVLLHRTLLTVLVTQLLHLHPAAAPHLVKLLHWE